MSDPLLPRAPEWLRRVRPLVATLVLAGLGACADGPTEPAPGPPATLTFRASVPSPAVSTLVAEVTAADIADPLVFNFELGADGTVDGEITIPSGAARTITIGAFDAEGTRTHEGSATVDVVPGDNPTITIVLAPLPGEQPITVVLGEFLVDVQPDAATVAVDETVQLTVTITDSEGNTVDADATWATDAPAVATVDEMGLVTGVTEGGARIVASFAGVADLSDVTVGPATANTAPAVTITEPADGSEFLVSETLELAATADDAEDGDLSASVEWSSDLDGALGTGASISVSLSEGTHVVTASATDGEGLTGDDQVTLEVLGPSTSQGASLAWERVLGPVTDPQISLNDVWVSPEGDAFAVGGATSRSAVLRYDGTAWMSESTGSSVVFIGVGGTSNDDVYVVGAGGTIRHWDGTAWSSHTSNTTATLNDVVALATDDVWVVGEGVILHYDGNADGLWTVELTADDVDGGLRLFSAWGSSASDLWAAGPSGIWHWDGAGWSQARTEQILDVWGLAADDVFAVGTSARILHFDGDGWTAQSPPSALTNEALSGVWGTATDDVYAVGSFGTIIHDDGTGWRRVMVGGATLQDVWGGSTGLFAVGADATILRFDGVEWAVQSTGLQLEGVWGASGSEVYAVGEDGFLAHYDGVRWKVEDTGLPFLTLASAGFTLRGVWGTGGVAEGGVVWVVGHGGVILENDGAGWTRQESGTTSQLASVWGAGSTDVFSVGSGGTILHWNGSAWSSQSSGTTATLSDVRGTAGDDVWAVGFSGTILHWDGTAWSPQSSGTTAGLRGVWAGRPDLAWTAGSSGLLRYDGAAWTDEGVTGNMLDIWGAALNDVFALVGPTEFLHFDGATWTRHPTGVASSFTMLDVWGSSASEVFMASGGGVLRGRP